MGCLQGHPSPPGGILWRHQPATERKSVNGKRRLDIENGGGAFEVARGVLTACCPLCKHKAVGLLPPSLKKKLSDERRPAAGGELCEEGGWWGLHWFFCYLFGFTEMLKSVSVNSRQHPGHNVKIFSKRRTTDHNNSAVVSLAI